MSQIYSQIWNCVKRALPKAWRTCIWLFKIILPISLLVRLLQYSGVLAKISVLLEPIFSQLGLPGETAIIFLTSIFTPLYAPIALISSMSLTVRQITILALMCLVSHNLFVECSVQGTTGSKWGVMFVLRILMSFVIAFFVNLVMPHGGYDVVIGSTASAETCNSITEVLLLWLRSSLNVILLILVIVTALMILHYILDEFNLMKKLSNVMSPLMKIFGLPQTCSFLWLVGNIVGLGYGGAIMKEQIESGKISPHDCNYLNFHLAVSHSLLEDTMIFVALGASLSWIVLTRWVFAFIVVWTKKMITKNS